MTEHLDPTRAQTGLIWGVRGSFVRYVTAAGRIEVAAPATPAGESAWHFPLVEHGETQFRFAGRVSFVAHHGLLSLTIIDPWLNLPHGPHVTGILTVATHPPRPAGPERIALAAVDQSGAATLTADGVALFDFRYPAGTPLAPLHSKGISLFVPAGARTNNDDGVADV